MPIPSVHDVLVEARKLIRKGWCQFALAKKVRKNRYQYCLLGGLLIACGAKRGDYRIEAIRRADTFSEQYLGMTWSQAVDWNNAPERRKSHVLALLAKAIEETAK